MQVGRSTVDARLAVSGNDRRATNFQLRGGAVETALHADRDLQTRRGADLNRVSGVDGRQEGGLARAMRRQPCVEIGTA